MRGDPAKNLPIFPLVYDHHQLRDTIAALATAPGLAAIAVIRVSGKDAFEIVNHCFKGKSPNEVPSHTVHLGYIMDENNEVIDQVLITVFKGPHSYTGEDTIEISSHGSTFIQQAILNRLVQAGARAAGKGEFTFRAFMNGKMDITQAEGVADIIAAESKAEATMALNQLRGGITKEIAILREQLIHFASMLELELDFGEEDVEFADRSSLLNLLEKAQSRIRILIDSFKLGNAIKQGVTTVIAGRPNAGKSTLLNVLLQEERAIVSEIPGTTRDTIEEVLHIEGIPFRLVDTAGIREAQDQIEAIGVQRTHDKIKQSSILLYVLDITEMSPADVQKDLEKLRHDDLEIILVLNKMDLNPYAHPEDYIMPGIEKKDIIPTSARNNMNIVYLKERLLQSILRDNTLLQQNIITNSRHVDCLQKVQTCLDAARINTANKTGHELIAMDIRQALHYLGLITGEIAVDDLLESIFSKFCIGK